MGSKPPPADLSIHAFADASALEHFYDANHATLPGFYLKFAKKNSGIPSVTGAEAVDAALCYGWIDGRANGFDEQHWLVRYTPRRAKSIWSRKNVDSVARLIEQGRMRPAGLAAVDAAKADGRWERAYAGPATMVAADDFMDALRKEKSALVFYESFNKSDRYAVLWRIETASANARAGRIEALVQMLAAGKKPGESKKEKSFTSAPRKSAAANSKSKTKSMTAEAGVQKPAAKKSRTRIKAEEALPEPQVAPPTTVSRRVGLRNSSIK